MPRPTEFWEEVRKLQEPGESMRAWSHRMGVSPMLPLGWERGAIPKLSTLKKICRNLKLPQSEFFRFAGLIEGIESEPKSFVRIKVYVGSPYLYHGKIESDAVTTVTVGADFLGFHPEDGMLVGITVAGDRMTPTLPRGCTAIVSTDQNPLDFESGGLYAVVSRGHVARAPSARQWIVVRRVVRADDELYLGEDKDGTRYRAWSNDPSDVIIGQVVAFFGRAV